jgi:hypothetical protein
MTPQARIRPLRVLKALCGLLIVLGFATARAGEAPALGLSLFEDGRIGLTLARPTAAPPIVADPNRLDLSLGLSVSPAGSRPALCALSLGSILCAGTEGEAPRDGGVALTWSGDGWRLSLDYRRLLASPAPSGRGAADVLVRLPEAERLALSGEFGGFGLSLALDRWQSASMVDLPLGPGIAYGLEREHTGLSLDFHHGGIAGRLAARRSEDLAGGAARIGEAIDIGLLLRTPWRAEVEMGALNLWHDSHGGERSQPTPPRIGRTPYVRYRQDF